VQVEVNEIRHVLLLVDGCGLRIEKNGGWAGSHNRGQTTRNPQSTIVN